MNYERIKSKAEKFQNALLETIRKRDLWDKQTKDLIYSILSTIKGHANLDMQVQKVPGGKNMEAVNLQFNKSSSGLVENAGHSTKVFVKYGGYIAFSQAYNGDIWVIMAYPYVEEFVSQKEHEVLDKVAPENITEDYIIDKVEHFLDRMTEWETGKFQTEAIGFKSNI